MHHPTLDQLWSTGWSEKKLNDSSMQDRTMNGCLTTELYLAPSAIIAAVLKRRSTIYDIGPFGL